MARVTQINNWIAVRLTLIFGTMWTAYLFFLYGFLPLFFPTQKVTFLYWSNTVQLWSLPLILVGTNLLNRSSTLQAQRQYEMVQRIDAMAQELHLMMETQATVLETLMDLSQASITVLRQVEAKAEEIDSEVDHWTAKEGSNP
jgi:hypothetical protein